MWALLNGSSTRELLDCFYNRPCISSIYSTCPLQSSSLNSFPNAQFFVVDEPETLRAQRAMLDEVLPNRNLHPRPAYVNVSWGNLATLIPALTAAGFDPGSRAVFVAEGLLPHLDQESVETLLSDISALASPGSTMAFDFLHEDVLEGRVTPAGYANLALAVANKGEPFLSGMRPVYSALVRLFQGHSMRVGALMAPADLAAWRACAAKGAAGAAPQGDQGQSRCSLVSGLADGMPRYLSLASVTKAGARPGLRDAPQAISMDGAGGCDRSGRPDTSAGGPNCFVASLFTLLCGAKQGPAKVGAAAPAPKDKGVGKQVSGPLSVRGKEPPVSPARRCSGASSSSCDPAGGSRSDSPVQEQSSEWMLRTDTERAVFDGCALPTDMASSTDNGSESGTETITLPPAIGLDRAQSILPQSSGSSLTSHAALAAAAAAIAEEASEDTDPCSSGSYAPASPVHQAAEAPLPGSAQEGTMSVKDLKKLFSSLPQ